MRPNRVESLIEQGMIVKKEMIKKSKLLADTTTKKTEIKDSLKKKPLDFIKNISVPNFLKRKKNN